jgi:hypothetical protein
MLQSGQFQVKRKKIKMELTNNSTFFIFAPEIKPPP